MPADLVGMPADLVTRRNPTTLLGNPAPQMPFESRIPAPLASPSQAPVINGPMSEPAFRGMTGIGQ
jgi:hypothetical protein